MKNPKSIFRIKALKFLLKTHHNIYRIIKVKIQSVKGNPK